MNAVARIAAASFERAPWGWVLCLAVVSAILKGWPAIQDAATRAKTALVDRRLSRIEKLEARIEDQRVSYEVEVKILRHQLNNVSSCLDAILLLIEVAPDRAREHVATIRAMRAEQSNFEVAEKAAIAAARVAAAASAVKEAQA